MTSEANGCDPELLLRHRAFVAALAARLLADSNDADDVAQIVWSKAVEQPPREPTPGWLWRVVHNLARNHARNAARRVERERAAAHPEATPSTVDLLARIELERRVVDAVTEMAEPFRTVILLRYYEDLPPRKIAERLAVPVDTVHSRLKRGLERLREAMAERQGVDWKAALLPLLRSAPVKSGVVAAAGAALLTCGVVTMSTTKVAATLVALAVVGGVIWIAVGPSTKLPRSDRGPATASANDRLADPAQAAVAPAQAERAERSVESAGPAPEARAAAAASASTGSCKVHVLWSDATPASGILIELDRADQNWADESATRNRSTTSEAGEAHFTDVAPGKVFAHVLRGSDEDSGWTEARIDAGHETEVTVKLGVGMNVTGIVVDGHDSPVSDAEVVLCDWGGGEAWTLAHSARDGTFRMRAVGTHTHIGARAPGFAPSPMRQFTAAKGAEVELRIVLNEVGTELSGIVLGPQGTPVANALLRAGDSEQKMRALPDGATAMGPRPQSERSDAEGRFAFRVLPVGKVTLAACAKGLAPWQQSVELGESKRNEITVRLERGVTLVGTVKDEKGVPVPRADIEVGEWEQIGHRQFQSGADGSFRGEGLSTGELHVRASSEGSGKVEATLTGAAGETVRWDAMLARGLEFRGRVLDVNDQPVASAMVETQVEKANPGSRWWAFANTDKDGRFVLQNCTSDLVFTLTVRRKSTFPEVRLLHQKAGGEELVIHMPKEGWTRIRGRILDPEGNVVSNVHVSPWMQGGGGSPAETADQTGSFDLGPYPPGEMHLNLQAAGFPAIKLGPKLLKADEVWELGTLRFSRGGTLAVTLDSGRVLLPAQLYWSILDSNGEHSDSVVIVDHAGHSSMLLPGDYVLQVAGKGIVCEQLPFHVDEGAETPLEVELQSGIPVEIDLATPEGDPPERAVSCVITAANGGAVLRTQAWGTDSLKVEATLLPGKYTMVAIGEGSHGEIEFTVPAEGSRQTTLSMVRN